MKSSSSLFYRALLAIALMIGFYLLALGIASALFYIPYAEMVYAHRIHPKLALVCVLGGLGILWSVLPRWDRFDPPGPRLDRGHQPRLFEEIETVARSTAQAMPAEVYLVPDVNAWVSQRGGVMGFGSRRVMGLGLPLLRVLHRPEFRAVLAHEFGHYHGGDTKLGPWIYKTRGAIGRTLQILGDGSWLQRPFLWYGNMFLRVTHAISRRQEFVADNLAARKVGSQPLISGLRKVHGVAPAFDSYWRQECLPVLNAGFRPPLADGFETFLQDHRVSGLIERQVTEELQNPESNPYDTHPPLKERIEAVATVPAGDHPDGDQLAASLLEDLPALEEQMLASMGGAEQTSKLTPIAWTDVCQQVYVPHWRELVKANQAALKPVTVEELPRLAPGLKSFGLTLRTSAGQPVGAEDAEAFASAALGSALALLLAERGAQLVTTPGAGITARFGGLEVEPFMTLQGLKEGRITAADWEGMIDTLGIRGSSLGTTADQAQPA